MVFFQKCVTCENMIELNGYVINDDKRIEVDLQMPLLNNIQLSLSYKFYRNHPVRPSICLSIDPNVLFVQHLLKRWTDTDETLQSCSIRPEDVHEGG